MKQILTIQVWENLFHKFLSTILFTMHFQSLSTFLDISKSVEKALHVAGLSVLTFLHTGEGLEADWWDLRPTCKRDRGTGNGRAAISRRRLVELGRRGHQHTQWREVSRGVGS